MVAQWFSVQPVLVQKLSSPLSLAATPLLGQQTASSLFWISSTILLLVALVVTIIYGKQELARVTKAGNFEQYKNRDLKKKLKMALVTIRKLEMNPDLSYARGFTLDYLKLRMDEEVFHYIVVNQIKMKVTQLIGQVLRPNTANHAVGIIGGARQIEEIFDVTYEIETQDGNWNKGVLFRVQIRLSKLPIQSSSATIAQIVDCIEHFLSSNSSNNWQPTIHNQLVLISWDHQAKPTPLLILDQLEEGMNLTPRKGRSLTVDNNQ